jgi:hypothetical protein
MVMGTRVNVRSSRQMDKPSRPGSIRSTSTIRGGSERTAATTSRRARSTQRETGKLER